MEADAMDDYFENIDFQTMSEDQYAQLPLRRKLLFELEEKLDIEIPAIRNYNHKAYREGTVYLTNKDLIAITRGVLRLAGEQPRYPMYVLRDKSERQS